MNRSDLEATELYSEQLGIDLASCDEAELFKWFLASVLYGASISETIATNTYRTFERYDLLTPEAILDAGRGFLIDTIMREGGYARYDNQRTTQILRNCEILLEEYDGSLNQLHDGAEDNDDLHARLITFQGIGPVTANIFLRELRPFWEKSNPEPLSMVLETADRYGISLNKYDRKSMTFSRVEAGLIRQRNK